ncbi:glycosyltransferase [Undibacterium sp. TJN25]|uniref:glycosyltransferase n=1 Tax=Undibacterium sp. TJN25 TaxID=3413056 RepID=UPI003BF1D506
MANRLLHIGAAASATPGFISVGQFPGAEVPCDVTQGLPFADSSVDGIHCEHFIETLSQAQGLALLRECRRVLTQEGLLRIDTPDLDTIIATYVAADWQMQGGAGESSADRGWLGSRSEYLDEQIRGHGRQRLYNAEDLRRAAQFAGLDGGVRHDSGTGSLAMEFSARKHPLDTEPLVSIVIPGYRARYFGPAIASALNQTYPHIEILVLDDSGNDDIYQLIQASGAPDRIRYLKNTPRLGEAMSLTRGISEARGQLIKPLYDDDFLLPDCVERMVAGMQKCPAANLLISRRFTINAAGERIESQAISVATASCEISGLSLAAFTLATGRNFIGPPSSVMFRRDDALTIPECVMTFAGTPMYGAGDVAMYMNLLSRGDVVFLMDMLSEFRIHDDHTSSDPAIFPQERRSWINLKHHGQRLGLIPADANIKIKRAI